MRRSIFLALGLLFATTMLSGCVVETPGYYHWGWHHHDRD